MGRLIIDDTTIYEIDEECLSQRMESKRAVEAEKGRRNETRGRVFKTKDLKEKPAP